jgi:YesN/AraC family two-component response regulator
MEKQFWFILVKEQLRRLVNHLSIPEIKLINLTVYKLPFGNIRFRSGTKDYTGNSEMIHHTTPIMEKINHTEDIRERSRMENPKITDEKQLILMVDDNEELLNFIVNSLHDQYDVLMAKNGVEGFDMAIEYTPNLIISDIVMPLMNGFDMCYKLKTDQRTSHIPIILLTAHATDESRMEGYGCGADDYISKPFNIVLLHTRINNLIENRIALRKSFKKEDNFLPARKLITSADTNFMEKVLTVIEKNMDDSDFDIEKLSRELGISSRQLLNKLQNLTEYTPVALVRALRLKRAEKLLLQRKATIAEIAYEVGFSDPNYFSKCFTKMYGKTPKEYMGSKQTVNI